MGCAVDVGPASDAEKHAGDDIAAYQAFMNNTVVPALETAELQRGSFEGEPYDYTRTGLFETTIMLDYRIFSPPRGQHNGDAVVLLHGMSESWEHFIELVYDLLQAGYAVYTYSHRGHGHSTRLLSNTEKVHVEEFFSYVRDLRTFIEDLVPSHYRSHGRLYGVGHSMGGGILSSYALIYPNTFRAIALSAPMHGPHLRGNPASVAEAFADTRPTRWGWLGGGVPFEYTPDFDVETDKNTHSEARHRYKQATWAGDTSVAEIGDSALRLGSPTYGWIGEAIDGSEFMLANAAALVVPTVVYQATEEHWVDNEAQTAFCGASRYCALIEVQGARHGLNHEVDEYRDQFVPWDASPFRSSAGQGGQRGARLPIPFVALPIQCQRCTEPFQGFQSTDLCVHGSESASFSTTATESGFGSSR